MAHPCDPELIYDRALARNPDGTCRCCELLEHPDRCPMGLIEKMTLRVRLGSDRGPTSEAQGANPLRIAKKFMDPEVGYYWDIDPDPSQPIRVSLVLDLPNLIPEVHKLMVRVEKQVELRSARWEEQRRWDARQQELDALIPGRYTPEGYEAARQDIINKNEHRGIAKPPKP